MTEYHRSLTDNVLIGASLGVIFLIPAAGALFLDAGGFFVLDVKVDIGVFEPVSDHLVNALRSRQDKLLVASRDHPDVCAEKKTEPKQDSHTLQSTIFLFARQ
jgi:hypothetical protein